MATLEVWPLTIKIQGSHRIIPKMRKCHLGPSYATIRDFVSELPPKMKKLILLRNLFRFFAFSAVVLTAVSQVVLAQTTVNTIPQGFMDISIASGSVTSPIISSFSLPLLNPASTNTAGFTGQSAGVITGVSSNAISNTNAAWTAGSLSTATVPYFLQITSGAAAGYLFQISPTTSNTATVATLVNNSVDLTTLGITPGTDTYQLVQGDTLSTLFGTGTTNGASNTVLGAANAGGADVVEISTGGGYMDYYYNTTVGQWRQGSFPINRNNIVIPPNAGINYTRKAPTTLALTILGTVPSTPYKTFVQTSGACLIADNYPVDRTLSSFGFETMPGWVTGTAQINSVDTVSVLTGGGWYTYYYNSSLGQWRQGALPFNRSTTVIPAGAAIQIKKSGSGATVVFSETLPYAL